MTRWRCALLAKAAAEIRKDPASHQSRIARHFRAFMVARSRHTEDQLAASIARGVSQYLI
jgi:O-methyltransferase involved in polyketide biosynthesis